MIDFSRCFRRGRSLVVMQREGRPRGAYATIGAAIQAASRGDQILIHAGTYTEPLDINVDVRLVAAGAAALLGAGRLSASVPTTSRLDRGRLPAHTQIIDELERSLTGREEASPTSDQRI